MGHLTSQSQFLACKMGVIRVITHPAAGCRRIPVQSRRETFSTPAGTHRGLIVSDGTAHHPRMRVGFLTGGSETPLGFQMQTLSSQANPRVRRSFRNTVLKFLRQQLFKRRRENQNAQGNEPRGSTSARPPPFIFKIPPWGCRLLPGWEVPTGRGQVAGAGGGDLPWAPETWVTCGAEGGP